MRLTTRLGAALVLAAVSVATIIAIVAPSPAEGKPVTQNQYKYPVFVRPYSTAPAIWVRQLGSGAAFEAQAVPTTTPGVNGSPVTAVQIAKSGVTTFSKAVVASDAATLNGTTTLGGKLISAPTAITATTGALASTGFFQRLTAAGTVTPTITPGTAGTATCFVMTSAQTAVFVDTGNVVLASNFSMGQYDVLCGWSDGTRWIETSRSNN